MSDPAPPTAAPAPKRSLFLPVVAPSFIVGVIGGCFLTAWGLPFLESKMDKGPETGKTAPLKGTPPAHLVKTDERPGPAVAPDKKDPAKPDTTADGEKPKG